LLHRHGARYPTAWGACFPSIATLIVMYYCQQRISVALPNLLLVYTRARRNGWRLGNWHS
jgi:hypothetical protein